MGKHDKVELWKDGRCVIKVSSFSFALCALPDGSFLSGAYKKIKHWRDGKCVRELKGHTDFVMSLIRLKNGKIASGSLGNLEFLWLNNNRIGDAGVQALAGAIASGSLANLKSLSLFNNQIGDAGVQALAGAIASGSLPSLQDLYLSGNPGNMEPAKRALRERKK